ncbi:MAG TPA: DNA-3-methyladenine glycosylase I, partial [Rubrobacter sp.]|nr:DNA-3-methyladenine glycosylase I [Rubrobacter sp.]
MSGTDDDVSPRGRCAWVGVDPLYVAYHDEEWGVPVHDDQRLFEMLVLEGAQAGLSWLTILKKRGGYRRAFDGFDPEKVARYGERKVEELLADPGIVRNRLKVEATVRNARSFLAVREEFGTFDRYLWGFVNGEPAHNRWRTSEEVPAETEASRVLSRDL